LTRAAYAWSAQITFGKRTRSRNDSRVSLPPSRSWTLAGVITRPQISPSVSTTICRLRPTSFFPPVEATWASLFGRLHALRIEDCDCRFGSLSRLLPHLLAELGMNCFPGSILLPEPEVMKHNPVRRQIMWQA